MVVYEIKRGYGIKKV